MWARAGRNTNAGAQQQQQKHSASVVIIICALAVNARRKGKEREEVGLRTVGIDVAGEVHLVRERTALGDVLLGTDTDNGAAIKPTKLKEVHRLSPGVDFSLCRLFLSRPAPQPSRGQQHTTNAEQPGGTTLLRLFPFRVPCDAPAQTPGIPARRWRRGERAVPGSWRRFPGPGP